MFIIVFMIIIIIMIMIIIKYNYEIGYQKMGVVKLNQRGTFWKNLAT